jgi:signal transduction histidine kinase
MRNDDMKINLTKLSQQYLTALREHLRHGPRASLGPALRLGCQAAVLGVKTLELARIHERALDELKVSVARNGLMKRATRFFCEAVSPIEEADRGPGRAKVRLKRLEDSLDHRSEKLAATNGKLHRGVAKGKVIENDFDRRGRVHKKRLAESLALQRRLRQLTHRALAAQEKDRHEISLHLQDEIAQTLLSIQVRLLNLKAAAHGNTSNLTKEIASTQRLVVESVRSINQFARELDAHHEA